MRISEGNLELETYKSGDRIVPHGRFVMRYRDGGRAVEGQFLHGRVHGVWYQWYANGRLRARHEYVSGKPHGRYSQWYPSGVLAQQGGFERGLLHGAVSVFDDGHREKLRAQAEYRRGRKVGKEYQRSRRGKELTMTLPSAGRRLRLRGGGASSHAKRVCLMNVRGQVTASNIADIVDFIGEMLTPEQVDAYLGMLDRLYDQLSFDTANALLVKCPGGFAALPMDPGTPDASPTTATAGELQAVGDACQANVQTQLGGGPGALSNAQWSNFVDQRVSHVDGLFDNCVDRINPLVSDVTAGDVREVVNLVVEVVKAAVQTVQGAIDEAGDTVSGWVDTGTTYVEEAVEGKVGEALNVVSQAAEHPDRAVAAAALVVGFYALKALSSSPGINDPGFLEHEMAMDALGTAVKARALQWLEEGNVGDLSNLGEPQTVPGADPQGGAEDMLPGSGGSCADMQAWWARVKAYCDSADWRTIECQQFLGVSADCLERVRPGPDGDPVCQGLAGGLSGEDLMREIRRRICEMTTQGVLVADGFGNEHCREADAVAPVSYDPCQDPHAQWLPDQCLDSLMTMAAGELAPPPQAQPRFDELTTETFDRALAESSKPVMVAFTAQACGPCARAVEALAGVGAEFEQRLAMRQVDVHRNPELAARFGIRHTPTLITFSKGKVIGERKVGAATAERLVRYLDHTLRPVEPAVKDGGGRDEPARPRRRA